MTNPPFHLAIPVTDLEETRRFYGLLLGCVEGRSTTCWIDWNFFGHQLTTHRVEVEPSGLSAVTQSSVDNHPVPSRHFGVVLPWDEWEQLAERLKTQTMMPPIRFLVEPYVRFKDQVGEQGTLFLNDPSGNALEFKSFKDINQLFSPYPQEIASC